MPRPLIVPSLDNFRWPFLNRTAKHPLCMIPGRYVWYWLPNVAKRQEETLAQQVSAVTQQIGATFTMLFQRKERA